MSIVVYIIFFLNFINAQEGLSMERLKTEYILSNPQSLPSCQIVKHRRREREKVLREINHNLSNKNISTEMFKKDRYILNKFFLENHLWRDEVVTIVNTWAATPELMKELETLNHDVFLKLEGDGILWQEKMAFFPKEVEFSWDKEDLTLVTYHQTYYADYCDPQEPSQLYWYPKAKPSPLSTLLQIKQIVHQIKENSYE